jgi:hypothetical protein
MREGIFRSSEERRDQNILIALLSTVSLEETLCQRIANQRIVQALQALPNTRAKRG